MFAQSSCNSFIQPKKRITYKKLFTFKKGNILYPTSSNASSSSLSSYNNNIDSNPFQNFNQHSQAYTNTHLLNTLSSTNTNALNNNNTHSNCGCNSKTHVTNSKQSLYNNNNHLHHHQSQRKTSPNHLANMPYYNHSQYNQSQMNGGSSYSSTNLANTASHNHHHNNISSLPNVSSLTTTPVGKAVTQSRLEKAKQLARNQHHHQSSSSSSSSNQTYLPPSPISSTCSVSNLSSLSSSVSVSPSSLSSSPSSIFNSNTNS